MADPKSLTTKNLDAAGYVDRINRFVFETLESNSAGTTDINKFDLARTKTYLTRLRAYVEAVKDAEVDYPKTQPKTYNLDPFTQMEDVQNEITKDFARRWINMRDEMAYSSQTSDRGSGFNPFDAERALSYISEFETYISNFVEAATPIDYPESHPETK